jgi:hypothetical protein
VYPNVGAAGTLKVGAARCSLVGAGGVLGLRPGDERLVGYLLLDFEILNLTDTLYGGNKNGRKIAEIYFRQKIARIHL